MRPGRFLGRLKILPKRGFCMAEAYRCPECGAEVPRDAPQGLCPRCVLKAGFGTQSTDPASQAGGESAATSAFEPQYVPPTPAELAPRFPDLEILELVGRGGMGVVYKARQKRLDRLVALKILAPKIGQEPAFAERFVREARAMAMLSHPQIVAVHDFGQTDGLYYFLMEFVDGVNLRRLLDTGKLAPEAALAIVPQICEALQYAHDHGVVHRDIKPENVLLDKEGRVKIADFGIAKLVGREAKDLSLTGEGQIVGTPQYMAPEQIEHPLQVDHRADLYALGVVFYQMLTGELPLGRFAPPSKKVQIDVRLDDVVLRALEKEPERRYQQASEIKTSVETIATTPQPERPPSPTIDDAMVVQARRQVQGPAVGLLLTGIVNWVVSVPLVMLFVPAAQRVALSLEAVLVSILAIFVLNSLMIFAALKMMRLQAYGLAIAASILGIIVSPGNLIGLPIGIWALVVLSQREVRAGFAKNREGSGSPPSAAGPGSPSQQDDPALGNVSQPSEGGTHGTPVAGREPKVSLCYLSTPEHLRTFRGRFLYIYKGKGELRLDGEALRFHSDWPTVRIPLAAIRKIARGDYPYSAKPLPIHFIEVTFAEQGVERTLLFTPVPREVTFPDEANRVVADWLSALQEAVRAATGRTLALEPSRVPQDRFWFVNTFLMAMVSLTIAFSLIPLIVHQRLPNQLSEFLSGPITAVVFMVMFLGVRWWRRRAASAGDLDALTSQEAGTTAEQPTWQPPDSGWGWLVGKMFGLTFTSRLAYRCANLSALGFLGFLGFMPLPGWQACFGFFGFFALIGVAYTIEAFTRPNLTVVKMLVHLTLISIAMAAVVALLISIYVSYLRPSTPPRRQTTAPVVEAFLARRNPNVEPRRLA